MSVTKSKTAEHDADIKDNSHKRAKLEAFAEAQALISLRPARRPNRAWLRMPTRYILK